MGAGSATPLRRALRRNCGHDLAARRESPLLRAVWAQAVHGPVGGAEHDRAIPRHRRRRPDLAAGGETPCEGAVSGQRVEPTVRRAEENAAVGGDRGGGENPTASKKRTRARGTRVGGLGRVFIEEVSFVKLGGTGEALIISRCRARAADSPNSSASLKMVRKDGSAFMLFAGPRLRDPPSSYNAQTPTKRGHHPCATDAATKVHGKRPVPF